MRNKLNLVELKINSFITSLKKNYAQTIKGGSATGTLVSDQLGIGKAAGEIDPSKGLDLDKINKALDIIQAIVEPKGEDVSECDTNEDTSPSQCV